MEEQWMNMPQAVPNSAPGLEYLKSLDQLLIHQRSEFAGFFTPAKNKYTIKNSNSQDLFYAFEDPDHVSESCYGRNTKYRSFDMIILDNYRNEVLHVHRPLTIGCCRHDFSRVIVSAPPGTIIGTVEEEWSCFYHSYLVKNVSGDIILKIKGPYGMSFFGGDFEFRVNSGNGSVPVGKISKNWAGMCRERYNDYFSITFPRDLDARMKALLLGALFLIDILLYNGGA